MNYYRERLLRSLTLWVAVLLGLLILDRSVALGLLSPLPCPAANEAAEIAFVQAEKI